MSISQERIREICKSFVSGMDAGQIAAVEGLNADTVELLLADHAKECCEIRDSLSGESCPYGYWTEKDGGNQPHNNLQPYITVFRYRRVA